MLEGDDLINLFKSEDGRQCTEDLQFYDSFQQKNELFGYYQRFESSTQFMYFINHELPDILGNMSAVYRGLSSACYRLFNKAQRSYIANSKNDPKSSHAYHQGILELIDNARATNNGVLPGFFKATGLRDSHLSILSFLQHYGAPTPFMDWTTDPFIALFFSIMAMSEDEVNDYHMKSVGYEIEDYFSLIFLVKDHALDQINDFKQLRATNIGSVSYDRLKRKKIQFIEEVFHAGRPSLSLINNLHIVNQKGLFIYNSSSYLPLEEVFFKYWKGYYLMNMAYKRETPRTPVHCIEIHKSVAYHIKKQLSTMGYTPKMIFSKPENIARNAVPKIFKVARKKK